MSQPALFQRVTAAILRPFSKVQPEEATSVVLMTLTACLLLTAYYLLKTVREPLILLQGGAAVKLYARAGQAVIMVGVVKAYGELARRVGRIRLLTIVFLFFISNLIVFAILAKLDVNIGLGFFLWVGVFSYTVIAQFWALAADIYTEEQGKRLFPVIGAGSSIGAVVGGLFAKTLVPFGASVLMSVAVVILLVCVASIVWIERRSRTQTAARAEPANAEPPNAEAAGAESAKATPARAEPAKAEPLAAESAWRILSTDKYLWFIAGMVVFLNWVNSSGEYLLDRTLVTAAKEAAALHGADAHAFIGAFKATYFVWYNSIGLGLQLLVVSRVLKLVGVRGALFALPGFGLLAYGSAVFLPTLAVMRFVKIGENSLQYSLQDTTRNALFLVTSRIEKFVGKTAIDTVAVRVGAIASAVMVFVGTRHDWSTSTFAAINVGLALVWMTFVVLIGREHKHREKSGPAEVAEPVKVTS